MPISNSFPDTSFQNLSDCAAPGLAVGGDAGAVEGVAVIPGLTAAGAAGAAAPLLARLVARVVPAPRLSMIINSLLGDGQASAEGLTAWTSQQCLPAVSGACWRDPIPLPCPSDTGELRACCCIAPACDKPCRAPLRIYNLGVIVDYELKVSALTQCGH